MRTGASAIESVERSLSAIFYWIAFGYKVPRLGSNGSGQLPHPRDQRLTGRKYQRLHGRLKGLFDNRYLGRHEFPWKKDIYYIAKPGLAVLLREGLLTDEQAERRVREGELKNEGFLDHEIMLSDIHVMLTLATQSSPWELAAWKEGKEIHDSFKAVVNGQYQEISSQPDAFFTLRDATAPAFSLTASANIFSSVRFKIYRLKSRPPFSILCSCGQAI